MEKSGSFQSMPWNHMPPIRARSAHRVTSRPVRWAGSSIHSRIAMTMLARNQQGETGRDQPAPPTEGDLVALLPDQEQPRIG